MKKIYYTNDIPKTLVRNTQSLFQSAAIIRPVEGIIFQRKISDKKKQ